MESVGVFHRGWQEARILTNKTYEITKNKTFKKDLRLSNQIQSAAVSVMAKTCPVK